MATLLATHLPEQTWAHLAGAYGVSSILTSFKNNYPGYFISQAVMYNKTILAATQQSQNLYGGNYRGLENYFTYIRNYFGQSIYDQVTAGFMQQSSMYTDSLRLEEWHLYGSSRIGIYQTNKAMAQRTVRIENGITTQLSNTHIEQLSLSRFYTERGAKRYELTNHLGNVLTVITDKKLPVCNGTSVSYFIADIVSATDYSPFGTPLAGRTWQGGEYRYGFNTQERDDEIAGPGNIMTAEYWEYDTRLGRRWNVDPLIHSNSDISSYSTFYNNPNFLCDWSGLEGESKNINLPSTVPNTPEARRKVNKYERKLERFARKNNLDPNLQSTIDRFNSLNANKSWMYISVDPENSRKRNDGESNYNPQILNNWYSTAELYQIAVAGGTSTITVPVMGPQIQIGTVLNGGFSGPNSIPWALPIMNATGNLTITNIGQSNINASASQNNDPANFNSSPSTILIQATNLAPRKSQTVSCNLANGSVLHTTVTFSSGLNSAVSVGFTPIIGTRNISTPLFPTKVFPINEKGNFKKNLSSLRFYFYGI